MFINSNTSPIIINMISLIIIFLVIIRQIRLERTLAKENARLLDPIQRFDTTLMKLEERALSHQAMVDSVLRLLNDQQRGQQQDRSRFDEHQINSLKILQDTLQNGMTVVRQQVTEALNQHAAILNQRVEKLTDSTDKHLKEISGQVEKRLSEGFEKTTATFTDVIKRLALIDEAQKKITELSTNVVSLQEILADKRSRGAFGEVQLSALIRNVLPEQSFILQHTLSNGKRADCILLLPEPTGNIVIDSKFPLENFRQLAEISLSDQERHQVEQLFRRDIRKHIQDISEKYILPGETADGAMMFIPAEAVFAEIHAHYPELVESAQKARVWMVSPTTMMAVLTTARAVLKDAATRKQVHIIQKHLGGLSKDFQRFEERMDKLARDIKKANDDVESVQISSKKITQQFGRIEQVELEEIDVVLAPLLEEENIV